jgi:prepilin-type N-terminal cleavage/methylation domain-containing protein
MKNAFKLNSNLPPLNLPLSGGEQKKGLFKDRKSQSAFTLVELAIVVVVLGILIGGVVAGQSIIDSAKRNAGISKIQQYKTAVKAFRLEFDATPGDMKDAYDYFGDECGWDSESNYHGCNGDGDRCVGGISDSCPALNNKAEGDLRRTNIHLALSGIMPDIAYDINSRDGNCGAGSTSEPIFNGVGVLHSPINNNKLALQILRPETTVGESNNECRYNGAPGILTTKSAKTIDEKIDDGNARRGSIKALSRFYSGDHFSSLCSDSSGNYILSEQAEVCNLRAAID